MTNGRMLELGWSWKRLRALIFHQDLMVDTSQAVAVSALPQHPKRHSVSYSLDDNETLRGLRAEGALAMALEGTSVKIMAQGCWA
jgi:hypothetical protein